MHSIKAVVFSILLLLIFTAGCGNNPTKIPDDPYIEGIISNFYTSNHIGGHTLSTIVFADGRCITFAGVSPSPPIKDTTVRVYYKYQAITKIVDAKLEDRPGTLNEVAPK
jgi:hypothetical protein